MTDEPRWQRVDPFWQTDDVTLWNGDARDLWRAVPAGSVDAIVTSPPYLGLRDYGTGRWEGGDPACSHTTGGGRGGSGPRSKHLAMRPDAPHRGGDPHTCRTCSAHRVDEQLGLEPTPEQYIAALADVLTDWGTTALRPGGSLWLNLGDTYATRSGDLGHHGAGAQLSNNAVRRRAGFADRRAQPAGPVEKCLLMIPERVAWALIERGWVLRNKVVWAKPNAMPTSATDRLANKWEYMFHLTRQPRYDYDLDAIREPHTMTPQGRTVHSPDPVTRPPGVRPNTGLHQPRDGAGVDGHPSGANPGDYWEPEWAGDDQQWYDASVAIAGCDVWKIATRPYRQAHFAVYPEEVVDRPIRATVPEHVCRACNTARRRIVERTPMVKRPGPSHGRYGRNTTDGMAFTMKAPADVRTVGWTDCGCGSGWRAGVVADPFAGAGTTAARARKLGRRSLLVELNPKFCGLIQQRLTAQGVLVFDDEASET
jgi:DNA modification methylase